MQLAILGHGGEGLLLDRSGTELDTLKDRGVEDVHASVDAVSDELDGLLNESVDSGRAVGLVNNDTILGRLLDLGDDNGTLIAMSVVEIQQVLEGVVTDNIRVEHEEGGVILQQDLLSELQGAGCVKRL